MEVSKKEKGSGLKVEGVCCVLCGQFIKSGIMGQQIN